MLGRSVLQRTPATTLFAQIRTRRWDRRSPYNQPAQMALSPGTCVGPYEVTAQIGVGGMGEVYRAMDTNLKRPVAIKVLPASVAADAERLARFQREAEVLASLNHPHIAQIHGLEKSDGVTALVMELVEGSTLADRIAQGPMSIDETLPIAKQIAEALEAAHERGIIHRDLKPANIKVRPDGTVKVLDFGLAKAIEPAGAMSASASMSPTITTPAMTQAGMILGTAAYMSPEQARGKPVDKRTDIWAFGCVLYEMLTGRRLFDGNGTTDTLALLFTHNPDWTALPVRVPPAIRVLLHRCLERERLKRVGDMAAIRFALEDVADLPSIDRNTAPVGLSRRRVASFGAGAGIGALVAAGVFRSLVGPGLPLPQLRVQVTTPATASSLQFALSPDGRYLAFVASGDGPPRLWVRPLAEVGARPIAGTEGAKYPFWSADSRSIGFFVPGTLYRVSVAGGAPQKLAATPNGVGGAWNADGTILFAGGSSFPLSRVSASGGTPSPVTRLDEGHAGHRFPQFLPDGQRFLFYASGEPDRSGVYLASLSHGQSKRLTAADSAAAFLAPDWVVFVQQHSLIARRLDMSREELTGDPVTLADHVDAEITGLGGFSVSSIGHVAFRTGGPRRSRLIWRDRTGKVLDAAGEPDASELSFPELSPDGQRVAAQRTLNSNVDVWVHDLVRGGLVRLTQDPANDQLPVWSPDGRRIAFSSNRAGHNNLYVRMADGSGRDELLVDTANNKQPQSWSADGRFLLYYEIDPTTQRRDLWSLDVTSNERLVVAHARADERAGQFSPDGRWVAYETNESGQFEVVVQSFPEPTSSRPVSTRGGTHPRWSSDGQEIYFISAELKLMSASVGTARGNQNPTLQVGKPVALFPVRVVGGIVTEFVKAQYAVSRDGRFLMNEPAEESADVPITLLLNWTPTSEPRTPN